MKSNTRKKTKPVTAQTKENITYGNKVNQNPLRTCKVRKNNIKQLLFKAPHKNKEKKMKNLHQHFSFRFFAPIKF